MYRLQKAHRLWNLDLRIAIRWNCKGLICVVLLIENDKISNIDTMINYKQSLVQFTYEKNDVEVSKEDLSIC